MIVKAIPVNNHQGGRPLGRYIVDARSSAEGRYILDAEHDGEKVLFAEATNCGNVKNPARAVDWIGAYNEQNTRSEQKSLHLVVSAKDGEHLTRKQWREAEETTVRSVGMETHPRLSAVHQNTDNEHMHIWLSRIDPVNHYAIHPYREHYRMQGAMRDLEQRLDLGITRHTTTWQETWARRHERGLDPEPPTLTPTPAQRLQSIGGAHGRVAQPATDPRLITDRGELQQLTRDQYADQDMMRRPKTVEQVSRQLNGPAITAAEKERFKLLKDAGANKKAREETLWQSRLAQSSINERRKNMGSARQWLHDHGVWRDPEITKREEAIKRAAKEHAKLSKAMKVLSPKIDRATSAVDAAFAQVRRPAEKELAALQEIGQRARTRLEPHLEAERERREQERQVERQGQRRGYGMSL